MVAPDTAKVLAVGRGRRKNGTTPVQSKQCLASSKSVFFTVDLNVVAMCRFVLCPLLTCASREVLGLPSVVHVSAVGKATTQILNNS